MPAQRSKCQIVAQAVLVGVQTVRVRSFRRSDGWAVPYLSVRIGRLVLNIEDPDALASLVDAARQAAQLAEEVFGLPGRQALQRSVAAGHVRAPLAS